MQPHKLQLKLFTDRAVGLSPEAFVVVFHGWIKKKLLPELMIDVANYAHVPKGPGVALIGHGNDYFIDEGDGRLGLLLQPQARRARPRAAALRRVSPHAARGVAARGRRVARGGRRQGALPHRRAAAAHQRRLAAPNSDATFAAIKPELDAFCRELFGAPRDITRTGDAKGLFSVKIATGAKTDVATLLARLGGAPLADRSLV